MNTSEAGLRTGQAYLQLDPVDNVLVALQDLPQGREILHEGRMIVLKDDIRAKHKFFTTDLAKGAEVLMYGVLVGEAQEDIKSGSLMTTENTRHAAGAYRFRGASYSWRPPDIGGFASKTFMGYHRNDGKVGTANYWIFIPTVFCENRNLDVIREALHNALGYGVTEKYRAYAEQLVAGFAKGEDLAQLEISLQPKTEKRVFRNIDGIKFLNHSGGCGGTRQDANALARLLAAYADHPNVAGVTMLSLGCQHLQVKDFVQELYERNPHFDKPLLIFEQQLCESEEQLVREAIRQTFLGLIKANELERKPAPLNKLNIGVKCGGSDGFSGISANPAVGYTADLLVALGGTVLLAEFPELCGVEQNLIDRAVSQDVAVKFIDLMRSYDNLARKMGSGFHMNPSPGNIRDGLITDAMKSAGAAKKGGSSPVVDVLDYTEPAIRPGLNLVCTPGNDVEATTGKAAAGATLILFTTGLGTPTGNPVCPVIKVSTNTALANKMGDIIDVDTGAIIRGEKTIKQMGEELLEVCIQVASGEQIPKAVLLGQDDFIPWKRGVSL